MNVYDIREIIGKIYWTLFLIMIVIALVFILITIIDVGTRKAIGEEKAKCIDNDGNEFVDEYCYKEVICSWLGLASENRCSKVKVSISDNKRHGSEDE